MDTIGTGLLLIWVALDKPVTTTGLSSTYSSVRAKSWVMGPVITPSLRSGIYAVAPIRGVPPCSVILPEREPVPGERGTGAVVADTAVAKKIKINPALYINRFMSFQI